MKYIIFGTGRSARMGYSKLKDKFEIVAFADNNSDKQGKELLGKKILKPSEISKTDNEVIICSAYYNEIKEQLDELGIRCNLYVSPKSHLLMTFNREEIYNRKPDIKKVLFVAFCECIRPRKIAELLKERGIQVDFAYAKDVCESLKYYKDSYNNLIPILDIREFYDYVDKSDYDIVHSFNYPDCFSALLADSSKIVVHDTQDLESIDFDVENDGMVLEFLANKKSSGIIFTTEQQKEIVLNRYNIQQKPNYVLNNYILEKEIPREKQRKLSEIDGELHCVYEGGISDEKNSLRDFEYIFSKLTDNKIHVHFYSPTMNMHEYCVELSLKNEYLHFEGEKDYSELLSELSKYDVGLAFLNTNPSNLVYVKKTAAPNKIWEYLSANIPVAINVEGLYPELVNNYKEIEYIDIESDLLKEDLYKLSRVKVDDDFIVKNRFSMDSRIDDLIDFYKRVIEQS